jgi:hypothetical protein
MSRIAKRSNQTRDEQRPPRLSPPVNAVILAGLGFARPKPATKSYGSPISSKKKWGSTGPSSPKPAAQEQKPPATQPKAQERPPAREQAAQQPPAVKKTPPAAAQEHSPAKQPPAAEPPKGNEQRGGDRPFTRGEKPGFRKNSFADNPPAGGEQLPAKEGLSRKDQPMPKPPDAKKEPGPANYDRRPPNGSQTPLNNHPGSPLPARSEPPAASPGSPKTNPPTQPGEAHLPGPKSPGMNGGGTPAHGAPSNGSGTSQNGSTPTNKNGMSPNVPGASINGSSTSTYGNDRKTPGTNGHNSHPSRTSLFRPAAFATMPAMRFPPRTGGPEQKPPERQTEKPLEKPAEKPPAKPPEITQIPMETSPNPNEDQGRNETPRSETQQGPRQLPSSNAFPHNPVLPKQPDHSLPSLEQLINQLENLPDKAVVFGMCDDGLPVLLDLQDPAPGAVVVIGDQREAQLEFLRSAVASIAGRNSPRSVQFLVFSCEPETWKDWITEKGFDRHCLAIESADQNLVQEWILRLADWTEQRRLGQNTGPTVLLVMDTLSFLSQLEYDVRLNFDWLAKEGPPAEIWPLAVISTDLAKALSGRRMLRGFQTRIMGYATQPADYVQLAGLEAQEAETFGRRGEFAVKVGDAWLRFKLPGR